MVRIHHIGSHHQTRTCILYIAQNTGTFHTGWGLMQIEADSSQSGSAVHSTVFLICIILWLLFSNYFTKSAVFTLQFESDTYLVIIEEINLIYLYACYIFFIELFLVCSVVTRGCSFCVTLFFLSPTPGFTGVAGRTSL